MIKNQKLDKFEVMGAEHGNVLGYVWAEDVAAAWYWADRAHAVPIAVVRVRKGTGTRSGA
jgi:hypothetical protein